MSCVVRHLAVLIGLAAWAAAPAMCRGQEETRPSVDPSPASTPDAPQRLPSFDDAPEQAAPDVYYLPDGQGGLRRVLGFRYDDFWEAWKAMRDRADQPTPPDFSIQRIRAKGIEEDDKVKVSLEIDVALFRDGWVRAPLDLGSLILREARLTEDQVENPPGDADQKDEAPAASPSRAARRPVLSFNDQLGQLEVWLDSTAGAVETIALEGFLPITQKANQKTIELKLPAPVLADIRLEVDGPVTSIEGVDQAGVTTTRNEQGRSTARLVGVADAVRASWRPSTRRHGQQVASLEAIGQASVEIAMDRIAYRMQYKLNPFGQELSRVEIRLPAGAALIGSDGPYEVATRVGENDGATTVEIRFADPTADPPPIALRYETADLPGIEPAERTIVTPRVVGAYRQHGMIALTIDPRLQAYFETSGPIEQIARTELPAELRTASPTAAFAYAGVDWSLQAATQPQELRVRVEPLYRLALRSEQADLQVQLDYQVTGGRIFAILVDLAGWSLVDAPLEAGGRIDQARIVETSEGLLRLPLRDAVDDSLSLDLTLRRPADLGANSWPLPTALDAVVAPGRLSVESRPALRAVPLASGLVGIAQLERNNVAATAEDEATLEFETFASDLRFAAELSRREQKVAIEVDVDAKVVGNTCEVVERLAYQVDYEPLRQAEFVLPRDLWEAGGLEWELDGQPLPSPATIASASGANSGDLTTLVMEFPQPLLGQSLLVLRYQTPLNVPATDREAAEVTPLVMPREDVARVRAVVTATGPYEVLWSPLAAQLGWTVPTETTAEAGALSLASSDRATRLPLEIRPIRPQARGRLTVKKAWIQTWLAARQRQDRTVYEVRTRRDSVALEVPNPTLLEVPIEVLVDGTPTPWQQEGPNRMRLQLPPAGEAETLSDYVLEFRIRTDAAPGMWAPVRANVPRLIDADARATTYWQVILPSHYTAATTPEEMSADYWLGWSNYRWGRQPTRDSDDLERWIGARAGPPTPKSSHQYLYVAFQLPGTLEATIVRRAWLVAASATGLLTVVALLVNTSLGQRIESWMAISVVLLVTGYAYPEAATLLFAGLLIASGATLAIAAGRWLTTRRPGQAIVAGGQPRSSVRTAATDLWPPPAGPDGSGNVLAESLTSGSAEP